MNNPVTGVLILNELWGYFSPSAAISLQVLIIKELANVKNETAHWLETAANAQGRTSPQPAHPQYLHSIIHEELPKVNDDFRKGRGEAAGGCKAKKMRDLFMLSKNLTNIHSTCILRFELGWEGENQAGFALISRSCGRMEIAKSFRRNGGNEQDYWN